MPQYLLSVFYVEGEDTPEPDEMQAMFEAVDRVNAKMKDQGAWVFGGGLHEPATATVVDGRGAEAIVTDGPFAEAKEQLGGFWVLTAPDLDAAMTWATEASAACQGPVEVRPFQDDEASPSDA